MKKRLLSTLIILVMLIGMFPSMQVSAAAITAEEMQSKFELLKQQYPQGSIWKQGYSNAAGFDDAWECYGFARLVYTTLFNESEKNSYLHRNIDDLCVGDHIRFNVNDSYDHSILVTNIVGDKVYYVDCNSTDQNGDNYVYCIVRWDKYYTKSQIQQRMNKKLVATKRVPNGNGYISTQKDNWIKNLPKTASTTPPAKPTITSCTASGSNISVSWNAVADATTYSIDFCKVVDGTYNHSYTSTSSTSLTKSLDDGWYAVRVEAGNSAGSSGFSGFYYLWVSNKTVPHSPQIKDIIKDGNTVTVTWDGVDYANKYSVQFYNSDKDSRASYESAATSLTLELETARYGVRIFAVNSADNSSANTSFAYFYLGNITVNLDACGGEITESTRTIGYGESYGQLPTPANEGYKFKGWYTASSGGTQITNETVVTTSSTHTLYAQWEKAEDFIDTTVTLNNNSYTIDVDNNFSSGKIIVAGYNEDTLIQVTTFIADGTAKNQTWDNITIDTVKIFAWESLNQLKPVMMQEITKDSFTNASEIWVLKSELPTDAEVIDTKYTYTLTSYAESAESQMDGWTLYDSEWKESSANSFKYAPFPDSFGKDSTYYKTFKTTADSAYETETAKRTVSTSHSGYIYWHWCRNSYTSGPINRWVEDAYKSTSNGNFFTFHAFDSTTNVTESDGESCYKYSNGNCCKDSYWYYKLPYYTCNTTDYTKVYKFEKTEDLESENYPWNENASNVQEWVCYIG